MLPTVFWLRPSASAVSLPSNGWPWSMRFLQCARMQSHFGGFETGFARFVVDFSQFGEFLERVFVFQRVPFLSFSINRLFFTDELVHVDSLLGEGRLAGVDACFPVACDGRTAFNQCHWDEHAVFHLATVLRYSCAEAHRSATARWYLTLRLS